MTHPQRASRARYPRLLVHLSRVRRNVELMVATCRAGGVDVMGVTKGVCGDGALAKVLVDGGVKALGDSRLDNLRALSQLGLDVPLWLIRSPGPREVGECVALAQGSLQSDPATIRRIARRAAELGVIHRVLLMVDLETGREGLHPDDVAAACRDVEAQDGVRLEGLGAYFDYKSSFDSRRRSLERLVELSEGAEVAGRTLSGGASNILELAMEGCLPAGINQLRLGTAPLLGLYSSDGPRAIDGWELETVVMEAEVIEVKRTGQEVLLSLGYLDAPIEHLYPREAGAKLLRQSSDHTVMRVAAPMSVGEKVTFRLGYPALVRLMASRYTEIEYLS